MDCLKCKEDLTAYLDGELNPGKTAKIRSHLETCISCTEEMRSLQKAADFFVTHAKELEVRPGSWNLLKAQISTTGSPSPSRLFGLTRWRYALAALIFFMALGGGYLWHQQTEQRNLDEYIAQYVKSREAVQAFRSGGDTNPVFSTVNFKAGNPFIEVKAIVDVNPFRSEDR